ncbi:MAG: class I SAM-dependent methyltransferase [Haliea sp.]|jgi:SAM-dependent methyltransferase|nr:class I SAM-dependent methyltransferase [Haliea sp.]MBK6741109.1 class I SAM-dependent methyltransferase [Haliea sp.]
MGALYDTIGKEYSVGRRTDPKIAAHISRFLAGAASILNIGAGTGSYETGDANLIAVEPSRMMINQRSSGAYPVAQASAESLPFKDGAFTHSMTVLSMHHWSNRTEAFKEIKRVTTQRFVAVTWNPASKPYWLSADYFPEIHHVDQAIFPSLQELTIAFPGMKFHSLPIPSDCIDGFTAAYWAKPQAYLDPIARQSMSTFTKIGNVESGLSKLESDLKSGIWENRYAEVTGLMELDVGYKVAVWDAPNVVLKLRDESTPGCAKTPWPGATTGASTRSPCAAGP